MVDRSSPPAPRDVAGVPSRRALLTAASLAPLALLTACRVRLEDDAPRVPLIPTREPTEDEALLLAAWRASTDLGRMTTGLAAGSPPRGDGPSRPGWWVSRRPPAWRPLPPSRPP